MKPRLIDIARLAGVSKATASRALADSPLVNEETKQRVNKIAKELFYQPNALAQAVATKRSGILGFCMYRKHMPYFGHTFFGPLLDGAIQEAKLNNFHIVVATTEVENGTFDEHFIQDSIDGAILISFKPRDAMLEFGRRNIPLVFVNDAIPSPNNAFIVDENYNGARRLMEHLVLERGHRKIAFISDRISHPSYYLRYLAYLDVHREHDIPVYANDAIRSTNLWGLYSPPDEEKLSMYGLQPQPVIGTPFITEGTGSINAYKLIQRMLETQNLPTAIFAATDSIAMGAIKAILDAGLKVPQDIAVVGYDDIEAAEICYPALTTVRVNRNEMGRLAVRELLAQIADPGLKSRMLFVENELIIRQST